MPLSIAAESRSAFAAADRLRRVSRVLRDPTDANQAMADRFLELNRDWFDGGNDWPANAPSTIARKGHGRVLVGTTGLLRRAVTERGAPGQRLTVDRQGVRFRLTDEQHGDDPIGIAGLASIHQQGTDRIPQRPLVEARRLRRPLVRAFTVELGHGVYRAMRAR